MKTINYKDLKIGQRVWFNDCYDYEDPSYVPAVIEDIIPPDEDQYAKHPCYVDVVIGDETDDHVRLFLENIITEDPELTTPLQAIEYAKQRIEELEQEIQELKKEYNL